MGATGVYGISAIARTGMISDLDATQTPVSAFSFVANARFHDDRITRGPIFSSYATLATTPRGLAFYIDSNANEYFIMMDRNGSLYQETQSGATNVSPTSGFTPSPLDAPVTSTLLANVIYFNRPDQTPFYRSPNSSTFKKLDTYVGAGLSGTTVALPANVRAKAIRTYNDALWLIAPTIGGVKNPKMTWASDQCAVIDTPPPNWGFDSSTSASQQNILAEMRGDLVDGAQLGNSFLLLGTHETYRVDQTGAKPPANLYTYTRIYDSGVMSQNCFCEHDSNLYVFGDTDLYITNGQSRTPLGTGKVKNFVYKNISNLNRNLCFVHFDHVEEEVYFCYPSNDPDCVFPLKNGNLGCNRAMVYSINYQSFTTIDLPYVLCSASVNTYTKQITWAQMAGTWAKGTGTWSGLIDGASDVSVFGSAASVASYGSNGALAASSAALRTLASYDETIAPSVVDSWASQAPVLLRKGMMDGSELAQFPGVSARLRDNKLVRSITPKGYLHPDALPMRIDVCAAEQIGSTPIYNAVPQFWTQTNPKLDFDINGRCFGFRLVFNDYHPFHLTGMDVELIMLGY